MKRYTLFGAFVFVSAASCAADFGKAYSNAWQSGKNMHSIDIDNDSLLLRDLDGFYSSGARYTIASRLPQQGGLTIAGWRIGHEIYTPSDIKVPARLVGPPDHPYAAYLYTGWFLQVADASGGWYKVGLDIGCIGPCAGGERVQRGLHRLINQPLPQGWEKQIRNEAGIEIFGEFAPAPWALGKHADIAPRFAGRLGNLFTSGTVEMVARAGSLNLLPGGETAHGFVRVGATAKGYDASLQGGRFSRNDPHTVAKKTWVGEAEAGFAWQGQSFGLRASVVRRSNEIRDLANSAGAQTFARLQVSYSQ